MKNNKILLLASIIMLSTGCVQKKSNNSSNNNNTSSTTNSVSTTDTQSEESSTEISYSQEDDTIGLIPEEVLNYNGEIDILTYIEGQNGTAADIGRPEGYPGSLTTEEIDGSEFARYVAAAREFKKIAPGVKINLIYCSISEYNNRILNYNEKKGHLPHLMHPVDDFYEMMENGMVTDLSIYEGTEYYQSISSNLWADCTFGNFVAAFPTHYAPYGMFVNKNILKNHYIVDPTDEDTYHDWIDNLTFEGFIETCKNTYETGVNAGFTKMFDIMTSYMYEDVYYNYITGEDHEISLNNDAVKDLIEKEAEMVQYSVYNDGFTTNATNVKSDFPEVKPWSIVTNFVNGYFTFNTEMPWNIGQISQIAIANNKSYSDFDYMPYPKASEDADTIYGNATGGLQLGNLCPIGEDGNPHPYSNTAKLERDVAAYFAMFMISDPRAVKAESLIQYTSAGEVSTGYVALPMTKKGFRFSFQDDDDVLALIGGDPAEGYADLFQYELALYLKTYPIYYDLTKNGGEPDVANYSNISYGLMKIINAVTDETGTSKVCNYRHIPQNISDGGAVEDIMYDWVNRYSIYEVYSETYVANLTAKLVEIENKVNDKTTSAMDYLQEMVDMYYGEIYSVS